MSKKDNLWCCRCHEDFPLAQKGAAIQMGFLYPLNEIPQRIKRKIYGDKTSDYLCGNCYFDILDEIEF